MKQGPIELIGTQLTGAMPGTLTGKQKEWALTCGLPDSYVAAGFGVPVRTIRRLRARYGAKVQS